MNNQHNFCFQIDIEILIITKSVIRKQKLHFFKQDASSVYYISHIRNVVNSKLGNI